MIETHGAPVQMVQMVQMVQVLEMVQIRVVKADFLKAVRVREAVAKG